LDLKEGCELVHSEWQLAVGHDAAWKQKRVKRWSGQPRACMATTLEIDQYGLESPCSQSSHHAVVASLIFFVSTNMA
jgi:hypothetical protein